MMGKTIRAIISVVLVSVIAFSAYKMINIYSEYEKGDTYYSDLQDEVKREDTALEINKVSKLKAKNPDVVGWITIENTNINYPVVLSKDNKDYLRTDLEGKYLYNGTPFIDYRSGGDFSNFVTVIYGHNMKNSAMFSNLDKFARQDFLKNAKGTLTTDNTQYELQFFAFSQVKSNNGNIYIFGEKSESERQAFLDYLEKKADVYIDKGQTVNDTIVVLSTCSYDFNSARLTVAARLIEK